MIALNERPERKLQRSLAKQKNLTASNHSPFAWVEEQLREHPVASLVTAATVGLFVGWVIKWRR